MKYTSNRITVKYALNQIKGFMLYIGIVTSVLLMKFAQWLNEGETHEL